MSDTTAHSSPAGGSNAVGTHTTGGHAAAGHGEGVPGPGPLDRAAWAAGLLGVLLGLAVLAALYLSAHPA